LTDPQLRAAPGDEPVAPDEAELVRLAGEISELARELAPVSERERRLAPELLARLRASGLMIAGAPREVDGLELPPGLALRCAEEVARGDASAGWCVSIAATSSLLAGYLEPATRAELFADTEGIAAGIFAPRGRARTVDGGVVVSGRWAYCSGIMHASVLFAGCFIDAGDAQGASGPKPSSVAMLRDELEVLDTWHTLGLRATGSHDTVADELFVPATRTLSVLDGPLIDRPLYHFPAFGYFAASIAAAALGNARGALDEFATLAATKVGQGSTRTLAERSATHAAVAAAEASLRGARRLYYEAIEAAWRAAHEDEPVSVTLRNDLRLAATQATRTSADVVRSLYDLAGGPAIYDESPLQRRFRDAFTATAHFQVNAASRELQGRILLGQPAETAMI
jgi:alkylation response protein AidB-like acyl-CoA dehydrogenase